MGGWLSCRRQHKIALFLTRFAVIERACSSRSRRRTLPAENNRRIEELRRFPSGTHRRRHRRLPNGPIRLARPPEMRHAEHGRDAVRDGQDRGGVERYPRSLFKDVSSSPDETYCQGVPHPHVTTTGCGRRRQTAANPTHLMKALTRLLAPGRIVFS